MNDVIVGGEYDFLFRDLIVLDLGCNIGTFSLLMSHLAKQIYALDISKRNIQRFDQTIKENGIKNIKTYNLGIAGKTGLRSYFLDPIPGNGGSMLADKGRKIQVYSVKDFLDKEDIDYIDIMKIDIEGGEYEVLNIDFPSDRVKTIVGEFHGVGGLDMLKKIANALGYSFTEYPSNHFILR